MPMSQNKFDREVAAFFEHFERDVLPKIGVAAFSVVIYGKPDAKLCLEVGASILLEKPLIVVADSDGPIPLKLRNIASAVIVGKMGDPSFEERLTAAIRELMKQRPPA